MIFFHIFYEATPAAAIRLMYGGGGLFVLLSLFKSNSIVRGILKEYRYALFNHQKPVGRNPPCP